MWLMALGRATTLESAGDGAWQNFANGDMYYSSSNNRIYALYSLLQGHDSVQMVEVYANSFNQ